MRNPLRNGTSGSAYRETVVCVLQAAVCRSPDKARVLFQYGMLWLSYPKNTNCLGINIWTVGRMLVMLNTESRYYLLTLHEPEIVQEIIRWFQIMQRYSVLLSKEVSIRFCEEKLREAGVN